MWTNNHIIMIVERLQFLDLVQQPVLLEKNNYKLILLNQKVHFVAFSKIYERKKILISSAIPNGLVIVPNFSSRCILCLLEFGLYTQYIDYFPTMMELS